MSYSLDPGQDASSGYDEAPQRRRHILGRLLAALVMAASAGGLWYAYDASRAHRAGDVPLIRADEGATKVRPAQPGGMTIPDQNMMVYNEGRGQQQVENLLPPPETPLPRPAPPPAEAAPPSAPPEQATAAASIPPATLPQASAAIALPSSAPLPPVAAPAPLPVAAAPIAPAQSPVAAAAAAPLPPQPASPPASRPAEPRKAESASAAGGYRLQLAALRSEEAARHEWEALRAAHRDLLGALEARWPRADLGARGTFYRVQAGPIADAAKAEQLCAELRHRNVACILVRP
ncbi:MAG TPA: SPOR domain-containing protein [Stellaceae bacterium]|nr:SPOR domain-containing protein [Stellaceae bacterium]